MGERGPGGAGGLPRGPVVISDLLSGGPMGFAQLTKRSDHTGRGQARKAKGQERGMDSGNCLELQRREEQVSAGMFASVNSFDVSSLPKLLLRFAIQDVDDDNSGVRQKYMVPIKSVIPIPNESEVRLLPEIPPNQDVLALYPGTTCFYKATVVVSPSKVGCLLRGQVFATGQEGRSFIRKCNTIY
ncbi:SGF29 tudor-like domain-containing protein [Jimgerdemannia flammicorona]|uniref:SGF29 tudor-like domain-containing protein n=1 Tax=Jimgerdemannia flammicorona TaxID=994334 RepID=A0A433A1E9_9FUNG|nr:SGF29 tudor-like domain-containing protein [Jimgerdemannia flammicorona]